MIIMVHTSPKNVLCTRVIKGVDVEPFKDMELPTLLREPSGRGGGGGNPLEVEVGTRLFWSFVLLRKQSSLGIH